MTVRGWGRAGWGIFAAALVGLAVYMVSVGLNQASLIAGVAGFFVAVVGLALSLRVHPSTAPQGGGHIRQQTRDVDAKSVVQAVLRQRDALERWRLFRFERDIVIDDIYVQEELQQKRSQTPFLQSLPRRPQIKGKPSIDEKGPPTHERDILRIISDDPASQNRTFIIEGAAGSGKSTLLRNWTIQLINRHGESRAVRQPPLPVYVSLRYFPQESNGRDDTVTADELATCLSRTTPVLTGEMATQLVFSALVARRILGRRSQPMWILLFDGLDETTLENRQRIWRWAMHPPEGVQVVVSTRPGIVEKLPPFPRSARYSVCDFNTDQITCFVDKWFRETKDLGEGLKEQIKSNKHLRRLAAIPLLLTCLSLHVEIENNPAFPPKLVRSELLASAVKILLDGWDAFKENNRPIDQDRIRLGLWVFPRIARKYGSAGMFPYTELEGQVAAGAAELELSKEQAEDFLYRVMSSGTVVAGDPAYGLVFAHAVFFDFFYARAITEGLTS